MTLFELNERIASLSNTLKEDAEWLVKNADDPNTGMEALEKKQAHKAEVEKRMSMLVDERTVLEARQRAALETKAVTETDQKNTQVKSRAELYRAIALKDRPGVKNAYQGLGAIPIGSEDIGNGSNLLPTTMSSEIISSPNEENTMRNVEQFSQVAGLEEPRFDIAMDDDDLEDVVDFETAKELEASTGLVTYQRLKTKISVSVADTVLHGSSLNLVADIEAKLRSGLALKEKIREFATAPDAEHAHMSFYTVGIKKIGGFNLIQAIINALADLPDVFRANAKVVMRHADYAAYIRDLTNGAEALFASKPEDIIGAPVTFNDRAVVPIIGDFRYAKWNYDPNTMLDADKDVKTGTYLFVLTAWGDHQIRLASAFRLAVVGVGLSGAYATSSSGVSVPGDVITATPLWNTDPSHIPTSGVTYAWQVDDAGKWTNLDNTYTGYNTANLTTAAADDGAKFRCAVTYSGNTVYTNTVSPKALA